MAILIGLLTALLVLTCLFLGLLVLIQLPKKEAGMGSAFGGGMTDSILGAGSGNILTAATRYSAAFFLILALALSILKTREANAGKDKFNSALKAAAASLPPVVKPTNSLSQVLPSSNVVIQATPAKPVVPAKPAAKVEAPTFDATPTTPGATPTAPGEAFGATPTTPK